MICALLCASAAAGRLNAQANDEHPSPAAVLETANEVLAAFEAKDGKRLASLVHQEKGVRFSPSAFVSVGKDIVFSHHQVEAFWTDPDTYLWGYAEGTADPIEMTPAAYGKRYVLDGDYSNRAPCEDNDGQTVGTTTRNNAAVVYPAATRVEYCLDPGAGTAKEGEDWTALRLVFENARGSWLLIAVIHDARSF